MDTGTAFLALLRGAHLAALLSLFGTLLFAIVVVPAAMRGASTAAAAQVRATLNRQARLSLLLALSLGIVWFATEAVSTATPGGTRDWLPALLASVGDTGFDRALMLRLVLLLATLKFLRRAPIAAIALAASALGLQATFGHAASLGGGVGVTVACSDALHLLAAGAWLGGLLPLLVCVTNLPPSQAAAACERFTLIRMGSVAVIVGTAILQGGPLVGSVPALIGTGYGRVLLLKLVLFGVAACLAVLGRPRTLQAPPDRDPIRWRRHLLQSIGLETAVGLTVVLAAGFLGSLTPATQEQPLWPFSWRLSVAAIGDPDIRGQIALALAAAGVGVASAVAGSLWRRGRVALVALGACLLLAAAPSARLLLVEAYPTSYYRSPTGFAAASIVHGEALFAANCAVCHGTGGRGDGPMAGQLPLRPADLTAAHLWGHRDGELFWWVSNGRQTADGTQVMPAFASLLSDAERWAVIDFVRANNAGASQRTAGSWVVPIVAPALPVICAGLPAEEMRELHGSVVRVVADGDEEGVSHPPSIPPQEGYKVLILHLNRMSSAPVPPGECMAATPAAWSTYATLAGLPTGALPGAEFLVDPNGWLRAAWLPGSGRGWSTPDQLIAQVRLICTHPIASAKGGGHEHHD